MEKSEFDMYFMAALTGICAHDIQGKGRTENIVSRATEIALLSLKTRNEMFKPPAIKAVAPAPQLSKDDEILQDALKKVTTANQLPEGYSFATAKEICARCGGSRKEESKNGHPQCKYLHFPPHGDAEK